MSVRLTELNAFRGASEWADDTMLGLNAQGAVQRGDIYGGMLSAKKRTLNEKIANNAVRTELLKALAQTFDIVTDRVHSGVRFSQDFMQKLEKLLGPAFKREDFDVGEDGVVASGRPLTARRIKAIIRSAEAAAAIVAYNDDIMVKFQTNVTQLPEEFMDVAADAYRDVRDRYGEESVPIFDELHQLVDCSVVGQIFNKLEKKGNKRVTPGALRDMYFKHAFEWGARRLATSKTQQIINAHGGGGDAVVVFRHINNRHPEILRDIHKAKTPAAAEAAFDKYAQTVETDYERFQICNREVREFNFKVQNALAERLGVPVQNIVGMLDQQAVKKYGEKLMDDILDGKNPTDGENAIKAAFENWTKTFVDGYSNALAGVDGLNIPVSVKDRMKAHVLMNNNVSHLNFNRIFQIGASLQAAHLKELLDANAPKENVYNEMASLARSISNPVNEMFDAARAAGKDIGPDELSNASNLVMEVFFGNNPGLRDQIAAFLNRPDVQADQGVGPHAFVLMQFSEPIGFIPPAKDHILADLGTVRLNPVYAQALVSAAREFGKEGTNEEILALFNAGRPEHETLTAALRQFEGELDTATLRGFVVGVLNNAG